MTWAHQKSSAERDDLLSATRYAVMMLRFAETEPKVQRYKPTNLTAWTV